MPPDGRSRILWASAAYRLDAKPAVEGLQILYGKGLSMKAHGDCKSLHEGVLTEKDRPGWAPAAHEANFVFPLDVVILITARREKATRTSTNRTRMYRWKCTKSAENYSPQALAR